jgi:hypothetical protein
MDELIQNRGIPDVGTAGIQGAGQRVRAEGTEQNAGRPEKGAGDEKWAASSDGGVRRPLPP